MSLENTNTPNGDSNKDLYKNNEDVGKQQLVVTDMSEKDPEKDLTGIVVGDNTVTEEYIIVDNSTAIRDYGNVRINTVLVGEPVKYNSEDSNTIKLSVEEVKKIIVSKGAITNEAYIEAKKAKLEKKEEKETEENDKNNDGIDDRNQ